MKKVIKTTEAPSPIGPYNQAILVDNTLYVSGQIALNPKTMELVNEDIQVETTQDETYQKYLKQQGYVCQCCKNNHLSSRHGRFLPVNEAYAGYFNDEMLQETVQVAQLPKNVRVEISVIATFSFRIDDRKQVLR